MKLFLKLKHWQLFLIWLIASIQFQIFITTAFWQVSLGIYVGLYFGWFYSIGKVLNENNSGIIKKLNIWSIIYLIAITPFAIHFRYMMADSYSQINILILVASGIIGIISMINVVLISAKSIKERERSGELTFGNYALEFFLILYMIIGVWILQPKLNEIVKNETKHYK